MKNPKGISLLKLVIIIAIIIGGIIFIVAMSRPQNGISSTEKETREWEKSKDNLNKANENLQKANDNYYNALLEQKKIEENYK